VRIAVISDVHANWHALDAVLADLPAVDEVLCLGDVVGYGGDPVRCLDHIRGRGWLCLGGNHDRACADRDRLQWFNDQAATAIRWTIGEIGPERVAWLGRLPERETREGALLVHASPRDPTYEYVIDAASAAANLQVLGDRICLHGHSHLPGIFGLNRGNITHEYRLGAIALAGPALVNPGSVGQPRDGDPDASYGVWDTDAPTFEFRRVAYDREAAKRAIVEAGLPRRFAMRLDFGY
jgi:diadenosine tetraphosphatase ApaH/serine/threonine PP2A family protein phosphatase